MSEPITPTMREIVAQIADQLGETEEAQRRLLWRAVQTLGAEAAQALVEEARQVHAEGGLLRQDGTRRTLGGVFFTLVKARVTYRQRWFIFYFDEPKPAHTPRTPAPAATTPKAAAAPQAAAPKTTAPAFQWEDRLALLAALASEGGGSQTVKVTLIGRPGKIIEQPGFILALMPPMKLPSLPKGLPTPPDVKTPYAVFIATKQWQKVVEALQQPEDALIVEGTALYDAQLHGIAVFATTVTTKNSQRARRQEEPRKGGSEATS